MNPVVQYPDDFLWHQGMINDDLHQGMLTYPSDEETVTMETNSKNWMRLEIGREVSTRLQSLILMTSMRSTGDRWNMLENTPSRTTTIGSMGMKKSVTQTPNTTIWIFIKVIDSCP
jgi:hypothetical protein